ncbi:uncharacterized protein LOC111076687 [Drosophila obscura]|uniref:uncharacterized protein LOC111076687 n=1 Tax=Drosophila obscura TaxID=7282 RepID=UPI000BA0CCB9|nr:uncharacterized protein LOC111076687 [Drosophila obscura]
MAMSSFGHITKLVVNIGNGETRISYGDAYTRVIYANPSGLAFPGGMMDPTLISEPSSQDNRYRAESFLRRHFALLSKRLPNLMGVSAPDSSEIDDSDDEDEEDVVWYTWHLEEVEQKEPQRVEVIEWQAPEKGSLEIFNRFWHLQNCVSRTKSASPRCHCLKIKKTMDHIKDLIGPELQEYESVDGEAGGSSEAHDFGSKIKEVNDLLKQLHDLMELQAQCNRNRQTIQTHSR